MTWYGIIWVSGAFDVCVKFSSRYDKSFFQVQQFSNQWGSGIFKLYASSFQKVFKLCLCDNHMKLWLSDDE